MPPPILWRLSKPGRGPFRNRLNSSLVGATTYSASVSETASAIDTVSAAAVFATAASETVSASDVSSSAAVFASSLAESGTAADALGNALVAAGSVSESLVAAESITALAVFSSTSAEAATASDTADAAATFGNDVADTLAAVETSLADSSVPASNYSGDIRHRRRRKYYTAISDSIRDVLAQWTDDTEPLSQPQQPPQQPSKRRKKAIAKQIIVAAGRNDLLPDLVIFKDEIQQIGTAAFRAVASPDPLAFQAQYDRIIAIIEAMDAKRIEAEQDDEDTLEFMLLAA